MKKEMDKVIFESRIEIDEILVALETYAKEHEKKESVKEMISLLDAMYMTW